LDSLLYQLSREERRRVSLISSFPRIILSSANLAELIFFPSFCKLCSSLLKVPGERVVCFSCLETLRPFRSPYCFCCGRFFGAESQPHLCLNCLEKEPPFSRHRSCARYSGKLKDLILLYKYRKYRVLGKDLARFAFTALGKEEDLWWGVEAVVPIPLHPKREKKRGFNQAQVLARELARLKGLGLLEKQLVKVKNVPPQTSIEREEREKNVQGAFQVVKRKTIEGKILLLIDDVYTTGSTIRECSAVLREAGAREVRALTLAQA